MSALLIRHGSVPAVQRLSSAMHTQREARPVQRPHEPGIPQRPMQRGLLVEIHRRAFPLIKLDDQPAARTGVVQAAMRSAAVEPATARAGHRRRDDEAAGVRRSEAPLFAAPAARGGGMIDRETEPVSTGKEPVEPVIRGHRVARPHRRTLPKVRGRAHAIDRRIAQPPPPRQRIGPRPALRRCIGCACMELQGRRSACRGNRSGCPTKRSLRGTRPAFHRGAPPMLDPPAAAAADCPVPRCRRPRDRARIVHGIANLARRHRPARLRRRRTQSRGHCLRRHVRMELPGAREKPGMNARARARRGCEFVAEPIRDHEVWWWWWESKCSPTRFFGVRWQSVAPTPLSECSPGGNQKAVILSAVEGPHTFAARSSTRPKVEPAKHAKYTKEIHAEFRVLSRVSRAYINPRFMVAKRRTSYFRGEWKRGGGRRSGGKSMRFDSPRRASPAGCLRQSVSLRSAFDCAPPTSPPPLRSE
jgi:hypothetical protein